jgi:hypothetical protein
MNTLRAFERAFDSGLGAELDIRDCDGGLVISHNPVSKIEVPLYFDDFLKVWNRYSNPTLAINVKSDGLIPLIQRLADSKTFEGSFFFDMSVPESIRYFQAGLPVIGRLSEFEQIFEPGKTYWLDSFVSNWWLEKTQDTFANVKCFLVSPELHGRDHRSVWEEVRKLDYIQGICTDFFSEALRVFDVD